MMYHKVLLVWIGFELMRGALPTYRYLQQHTFNTHSEYNNARTNIPSNIKHHLTQTYESVFCFLQNLKNLHSFFPRNNRSLTVRERCDISYWSPSLLNIHHTSYIILHTSYIIHHTSYIIHHTSYIIHHTSYIIHHTSYIIHPPYIIHHTSYIIHHTSHITHHTSYIIHHT